MTAVAGLLLTGLTVWAVRVAMRSQSDLASTVEQARATVEEAQATTKTVQVTLESTIENASLTLERLRSMVKMRGVASGPAEVAQRRRQIEAVIHDAEQLLALHPDNSVLRSRVARSHESAAILYQALKDNDAALRAHGRAIELVGPVESSAEAGDAGEQSDGGQNGRGPGSGGEPAVGAERSRAIFQWQLATSHHNRHVLLRALGRHDEADKDLDLAIGMWSEALAARPKESAGDGLELALALSNRARRTVGTDAALQDLDRAEALWSAVDARLGDDAALDHHVAHRLQSLAVRVRHHVALGEDSAGLVVARDLIARLERLPQRLQTEVPVVTLEAEAQQVLASLLGGMGDVDAADAAMRAAIAKYADLAQSGTADTRIVLVKARVQRATLLDHAKRFDDLSAMLGPALSDARRLFVGHPLPLTRGLLITLLVLRAERVADPSDGAGGDPGRVAGGDLEQAERLLREAVDHEQELGAQDDFVNAAAHARLAKLLRGQGKTDEARTVAERAFTLTADRFAALPTRSAAGLMRYRAQQLLSLLDSQRASDAMVTVAERLQAAAPERPEIVAVALLGLDRAVLRLARSGDESLRSRLQERVRALAAEWLKRPPEVECRLAAAAADGAARVAAEAGERAGTAGGARGRRMTAPPDPDALLAQWQAGGSGADAALDALVRRQLGFLQNYVRGRIGRHMRMHDESIDFVQGALLDLVRSDKTIRIDDESALRGLLVRIVDNNIRDKADWLRRDRRDAGREGGAASDTMLARDGSVEEVTTPSIAAGRNETRDRLRQALDLLAPADREIILLHEWERLTFGQIAERLGIGADAARVRFQRALPRLARCVRELRDR